MSKRKTTEEFKNEVYDGFNEFDYDFFDCSR